MKNCEMADERRVSETISAISQDEMTFMIATFFFRINNSKMVIHKFDDLFIQICENEIHSVGFMCKLQS